MYLLMKMLPTMTSLQSIRYQQYYIDIYNDSQVASSSESGNL